MKRIIKHADVDLYGFTKCEMDFVSAFEKNASEKELEKIIPGYQLTVSEDSCGDYSHCFVAHVEDDELRTFSFKL